MVDIVYREGASGATGVKNAPLTHIELDQNFRNLNDYKVEKDAIGAIIPGSTGATGVVGHFRLNTGTNKPEMYGSSGWIVTIGATGYTGATGYQGASGATGIQGASGSTGLTGATGVQGASGSTGLTGATGVQGASGSTGVQGASGTGVNIAGSTGVSPPSGATGVGVGIITSDTGHLWVYNGSSWVDAGNITGPTGATGIAGATGTQGASGVGATGAAGASGADSTIPGATGPAGATGTQGASGISGASGYVGSDGATGPAGASGAAGAGLGITNDISTNTSYYPAMYDVSTGTPSAVYVSDTSLYFNPATGTLNAIIFNSLSDVNYKENIVPVVNATDTINKLNGVQFTWKDNGNTSYGVIAQELEQVLPALIEDNNDRKSVNYSGIIAFLINSIKELDARVKQLENK